jgi:hypothetical protein
MLIGYPKGILLKNTSAFTLKDSVGNSCEPYLINVEGNRALFSAEGCIFDSKVKPGKLLKLTSVRNVELELEELSPKPEKPIVLPPVKRKIIRNNKVVKKDKKSKTLKRNTEDWYLNLGVGIALSSSYSGDLSSSYESYNENYSLSGSPFILDGGLYYPKRDGSLLVGASMIYSYQSLSGESDLANITFSHVSFLLNYSMINFFGERTGKGFFVRGDVGFSFLATEITQEFEGSTVTDSYKYSPGIGFHFEYGYAFALSEGMSGMVSLGWTRAQGTLDTISSENKATGETIDTEITEDSSQSSFSLMGHLFF